MAINDAPKRQPQDQQHAKGSLQDAAPSKPPRKRLRKVSNITADGKGEAKLSSKKPKVNPALVAEVSGGSPPLQQPFEEDMLAGNNVSLISAPSSESHPPSALREQEPAGSSGGSLAATPSPRATERAQMPQAKLLGSCSPSPEEGSYDGKARGQPKRCEFGTAVELKGWEASSNATPDPV